MGLTSDNRVLGLAQRKRSAEYFIVKDGPFEGLGFVEYREKGDELIRLSTLGRWGGNPGFHLRREFARQRWRRLWTQARGFGGRWCDVGARANVRGLRLRPKPGTGLRPCCVLLLLLFVRAGF